MKFYAAGLFSIFLSITTSFQSFAQSCVPGSVSFNQASNPGQPLFGGGAGALADKEQNLTYIGIDPSCNTTTDPDCDRFLVVTSNKNGVPVKYTIEMIGMRVRGGFGFYNSSNAQDKIIEIDFATVNEGALNSINWIMTSVSQSGLVTSGGFSLKTTGAISNSGTPSSKKIYFLQFHPSLISIGWIDSNNEPSVMSFPLLPCLSPLLHKGYSSALAINQDEAALTTATTFAATSSQTLMSRGYITFRFNLMFGGGYSISSYNIYRKKKSDLNFTRIQNVINDGRNPVILDAVSASNPLIVGETYQYRVRPVTTSNLEITPANEQDAVILNVTVPPAGMVFVSRISLNYQTCLNGLNLNPDVNNYNSCVYSGWGNSAGLLDFGKDYFVDRLEVGEGLDYNSIISTLNSGLYNRFANLAKTEILAAFTNATDRNPATGLNPVEAQTICSKREVQLSNGQIVKGRLMSMKEFRALAKWGDTVSTQQRENLMCNTSVAIQQEAGQQLLSSSNPALIRTGRHRSSQCVSEHLIQDMVGNAEEWVSDVIDYSSNCEDNGYHIATSSIIDPTNKDLAGGANGTFYYQSHYYNNLGEEIINTILGQVHNKSYFNPVIGLPIDINQNQLRQGDQLVTSRLISGVNNYFVRGIIPLQNDEIFGFTGTCSSATLSGISLGGGPRWGDKAGRWATNANHLAYSTLYPTQGRKADVGFRCVMEVK